METKKRRYIAPTAELILLAPTEELAAAADDNLALSQWGTNNLDVKTSSTVSGSDTWNEDGTITTQSGG